MIKALSPTSYQYHWPILVFSFTKAKQRIFDRYHPRVCPQPRPSTQRQWRKVYLVSSSSFSSASSFLFHPLFFPPSALLPPSPPCPLSKCVVGRKGNKRGSEGGRGGTYQPQYRRVKWTLLVRAIAIQQESSAPLLSTFLPSASLSYSLSFSSLSSDFPEQRKGWLAAVRRES